MEEPAVGTENEERHLIQMKKVYPSSQKTQTLGPFVYYLMGFFDARGGGGRWRRRSEDEGGRPLWMTKQA